jgi:hypothetical protein
MPTHTTHKNIKLYVEGRTVYTFDNPASVPFSLKSSVNDQVVDSVTHTNLVIHWRQNIAARNSATNPMSGVKYVVHGDRFETIGATLIDSGNGSRVRSELRGYLGLISAPGEGLVADCLAKADNQAAQRYYNSIRSAQRSIQGLVTLGEIGQALRMIRHPGESLFRGMGDYLGAVKKRTRGRALTPRTKRRIAGDTWLEYSFGWIPLISDVKAGAEGLAQESMRLMEVTPIRGYGSASNTTFYGDYGAISQLFLRLNRQKITNVTRADVRYHGMVGNNPADWDRRLSRFGFSPSDFVPAVWELIPYSFLVDYFTNIGGIISAFSTDTSGLKWAEKGTRTSSRNYLGRVSLSLDATNSQQRYVDIVDPTGGSNGYEIVRVTRGVSGSVNIPSLEFKIPGLSLKWLNLAALGLSHRSAINSLR